MREAFEKVKAIIDGWDPVDLLTCCHCPSDEYDDISMELAQILTFDTDVETLKTIYIIYLSGISMPRHLTKVRRSAKRLREKLLKICMEERCKFYRTAAEQLKINGKSEAGVRLKHKLFSRLPLN